MRNHVAKIPKRPLNSPAEPVELTDAELNAVAGGKLTGGPPPPWWWLGSGQQWNPGPIYFQ